MTLLHRIASQPPEAAAIVSAAERVTYGELNARAEGIAEMLRARGAGPGALIGLCVERSPDMLAGILGILKCGAGYVPLDPAYPRERLRFIASDTSLSLILAAAGLAPLLADTRAEILDLAAVPSTQRKSEIEFPTSSTAYVIHTSGSTGQPKGVVITRANLDFSTAARLEYYREPVGRFLLLSSFAFDSSVAGIFWTLATGGALVLPAREEERDPARLARLIDDHAVTHLLCLPSLYALLLDQTASLGSLRVAIVAGETCPAALLPRHFERLPHAALHNEYGPTEATVWSTVQKLDRPVDPVPIGRAIPGANVHILDEAMQPAETGELYIGGPGLARGYLNRADLTAGKFLSNPGFPFLLYRTGDLARRLPDGALEFLGRADRQVKVRGYRIELDEIEAAILGCEGVREAAVVVRDDRLIGYVRGPAQVREQLAERLPDYMIPARFVPLDVFPLTPNGKIDRAALPSPDRERPLLAAAFTPPRDALERHLAGLWQEALALDRVGVHDPFFELGGDSLLAAGIVAKLQQALGEPVFVTAIFEAPTIAALGAHLRRHYAEAVARLTGISAGTRASRPVDAAMLASARAALGRRGRRPEVPAAGATQLRPGIFILAPPRSGTTLLRAMLAGHPSLFTASELHLLEFETLAERSAALTGPRSIWLDGTVRALMDLGSCDASDAARLMETMNHFTTREFYDWLQKELGARMLVEKTPAYGLDPSALRSSESIFDGALYIHLSRQPAAMIRSFAANHMDQIYFRDGGDFTAREAAELAWLITHENCLDFLASLPPGRQCAMRFEDLVREPRRIMEEMCARFGLAFHEEMIRPYDDLDRRSLAGVHAASKSMDDPKFRAHRAIDPRVAEAGGDDTLSPLTRALAARLGHETAPTQTRARTMRAALSQRRAARSIA